MALIYYCNQNQCPMTIKFFSIITLYLIGFSTILGLSSFKVSHHTIYNNLDKSDKMVALSATRTEWMKISNFTDTLDPSAFEAQKLGSRFITYSKIEVCKSVNGKACKQILKSNVHLNRGFAEELRQYLKANYPDNLYGTAGLAIANVVVDERGYILYYDLARELGAVGIGKGDDIDFTQLQKSEMDWEILSAAVKKFCYEHRQIDVYKSELGSPVFIHRFANINF